MTPKTQNAIPILTIAGSDCSGGAGIQADLKTFGAHNLFGMSVILSVVAENTFRVSSAFDIPAQVISEQMECIFEDIPPAALKIGMLGSSEVINCVAQNLARFAPKNVVIDPVMFAKNGFALMPAGLQGMYAEQILKFADVLTPNVPEAQALCGFEIENLSDMKKAAQKLHAMGAKAVLVKGGHLNLPKSLDEQNLQNVKNITEINVQNCELDSENYADIQNLSADVLFDGDNFHIFKAPKIDTKNTHGTGCTLSSAIASNLALGFGLVDSVKNAKKYVLNAIYYSLNLGKGNGPTNHFYKNLFS